jgi:hypothetical protein
MTYDNWKATNPADEFLGPEPEEEEMDDMVERVARDLGDYLEKHWPFGSIWRHASGYLVILSEDDSATFDLRPLAKIAIAAMDNSLPSIPEVRGILSK